MPWPDLSSNDAVGNSEQLGAPTTQAPAPPDPPIRPQRVRARPERYGEYVSLAREHIYADETDPKTFKQAKKRKN